MEKLKLLKNFILCLLLSSLFLCLCSCDEAYDSDYKFAENETGYTLTSVVGLRRNVIIPSEHNGKPVTAVADQAFYGNDVIRSLTLPSSIKTVGEYAFSGCKKLTEVVFSSGGSCKISDGAFSDCTSLKNIELSSAVYEIGDRAFENCTALGKLTANENLLKIGTDAFKNCEQLYISAPASSYIYSYAEANHISLSLMQTDFSTYLLLALAVVCGIAVIIIYRIFEKKRARKKESDQNKSKST